MGKRHHTHILAYSKNSSHYLCTRIVDTRTHTVVIMEYQCIFVFENYGLTTIYAHTHTRAHLIKAQAHTSLTSDLSAQLAM